LSGDQVTFPEPLVVGGRSGYQVNYSGDSHFAPSINYFAVDGTGQCCAGYQGLRFAGMLRSGEPQ